MPLNTTSFCHQAEAEKRRIGKVTYRDRLERLEGRGIVTSSFVLEAGATEAIWAPAKQSASENE